MNIHGVVVCRDDWGTLALSICNALLNHVDVVHVLNHGSIDQTGQGLDVLRAFWRDRLIVYSADTDVPYKQSLLTNMIVAAAESKGADWIYVFDADEFMLSPARGAMRQELASLGEDIICVRYQLKNYISTFNFNRMDASNYSRLIYKSLPNLPYDTDSAWRDMYLGKTSFFDYPFPSKLIFRAKRNLLVQGGSHRLAWMPRNTKSVDSVSVECAHLTYISRDTLDKKKILGESLISLGLPRSYGWQSQLIHKLHQEGRLDDFWQRHSIGKESDGSLAPRYAIDRRLSVALRPAIDLLIRLFGSPDLTLLEGKPLALSLSKATEFAFSDVFQMLDYFHERTQLLINATLPKVR